MINVGQARNKMGKNNPFLKRAFLDIVENQLTVGDPPETKESFRRLISQGISKDDAKIYIAQAVCVEVWDIMKNNVGFKCDRFIRNLRNLPQEPKE